MAQQPSPYRVRLNLCRFLGISLAYPALLLSICVFSLCYCLLGTFQTEEKIKFEYLVSRKC